MDLLGSVGTPLVRNGGGGSFCCPRPVSTRLTKNISFCHLHFKGGWLEDEDAGEDLIQADPA